MKLLSCFFKEDLTELILEFKSIRLKMKRSEARVWSECLGNVVELY
jgi:hypothetical protein